MTMSDDRVDELNKRGRELVKADDEMIDQSTRKKRSRRSQQGSGNNTRQPKDTENNTTSSDRGSVKRNAPEARTHEFGRE